MENSLDAILDRISWTHDHPQELGGCAKPPGRSRRRATVRRLRPAATGDDMSSEIPAHRRAPTAVLVSLRVAPGLVKEFVAIGDHLRARGWDVRYLLADGYRDLLPAHVPGRSVDFVAIPAEPSPGVRRPLAATAGPGRASPPARARLRVLLQPPPAQLATDGTVSLQVSQIAEIRGPARAACPAPGATSLRLARSREAGGGRCVQPCAPAAVHGCRPAVALRRRAVRAATALPSASSPARHRAGDPRRPAPSGLWSAPTARTSPSWAPSTRRGGWRMHSKSRRRCWRAGRRSGSGCSPVHRSRRPRPPTSMSSVGALSATPRSPTWSAARSHSSCRTRARRRVAMCRSPIAPAHP